MLHSGYNIVRRCCNRWPLLIHYLVRTIIYFSALELHFIGKFPNRRKLGATSKSLLVSKQANYKEQAMTNHSGTKEAPIKAGIERPTTTSVRMGLSQPRKRQSLRAQERGSHLDRAQPSRIRSSEAREVRVLAL